MTIVPRIYLLLKGLTFKRNWFVGSHKMIIFAYSRNGI